MAEPVVERLAVAAVEEEKQKVFGNSQHSNGDTLHLEKEHENPMGVVVEEDYYKKFVLGKKREEVGEGATLYLVAHEPKMSAAPRRFHGAFEKGWDMMMVLYLAQH